MAWLWDSAVPACLRDSFLSYSRSPGSTNKRDMDVQNNAIVAQSTLVYVNS